MWILDPNYLYGQMSFIKI